MESVEKHIDVNVPLNTAYNQWTQFESFPEFMDGVEEVRQIDDKRLHWKASIAGKEEEWDAEIVEQVPDQRIAWYSTRGFPNGGSVSFHPLSADSTRVVLRMDYEPQGAVEKIGDAMGLITHHVERDLEEFKKFIESRRAETGAWRGEVHGGRVERGGSGSETAGYTGATRRGPSQMEGRQGTGMRYPGTRTGGTTRPAVRENPDEFMDSDIEPGMGDQP